MSFFDVHPALFLAGGGGGRGGERGPVQVTFDSFNIGLQLYSVSVCLEKTLNSKDLMHRLQNTLGGLVSSLS